MIRRPPRSTPFPYTPLFRPLMNVQVFPPSSERNTPLLLGSGGPAGTPPRPPRPPPPPAPPPPAAPPPAGPAGGGAAGGGGAGGGGGRGGRGGVPAGPPDPNKSGVFRSDDGGKTWTFMRGRKRGV